MKLLNERQTALYNYLLENGKVNVRDICQALPTYYTLDLSERSHNPCSMVFADADRLNADCDIEKIIIHDSEYNFWLARDYDEVTQFVDKLYRKRALHALTKRWRLLKKARANGQGVFDEGELMRFVEAFAKEIEANEEGQTNS